MYLPQLRSTLHFSLLSFFYSDGFFISLVVSKSLFFTIVFLKLIGNRENAAATKGQG